LDTRIADKKDAVNFVQEQIRFATQQSAQPELGLELGALIAALPDIPTAEQLKKFKEDTGAIVARIVPRETEAEKKRREVRGYQVFIPDLQDAINSGASPEQAVQAVQKIAIAGGFSLSNEDLGELLQLARDMDSTEVIPPVEEEKKTGGLFGSIADFFKAKPKPEKTEKELKPINFGAYKDPFGFFNNLFGG
jgi:predicted RNase H-like HicB family nuclease